MYSNKQQKIEVTDDKVVEQVLANKKIVFINEKD
jgi:hypothetical protein